MRIKDSFCSYCGQAFLANQPWPRLCANCGEMSFQNPAPVAVLVVPMAGGVLAVRRGIEPARGQLSLPGGYINRGETWQQAGARELCEETGIRLGVESIQLFQALSDDAGRFILVFGLAPAQSADVLRQFTPNEETMECVVLKAFEVLAFPLHTQVLRKYFAQR